MEERIRELMVLVDIATVDTEVVVVQIRAMETRAITVMATMRMVEVAEEIRMETPNMEMEMDMETPMEAVNMVMGIIPATITATAIAADTEILVNTVSFQP